MPTFLRLYINYCFSNIWILLSLCATFSCDEKRATSQEERYTPVSDSTFQVLSFKTFSWISVETEFNSIGTLLLCWELVTSLRSNLMILVSKWKLILLHCCNSKKKTWNFHVNLWNFSDNSVGFAFTSATQKMKTADLVTFTEEILNGKLHFFVQWSLTKLEFIWMNFWISSYLIIFAYWIRFKTMIDTFNKY